MDNAGVSAEWGDILRDLNALSETTITYNGKSFAGRFTHFVVVHNCPMRVDAQAVHSLNPPGIASSFGPTM